MFNSLKSRFARTLLVATLVLVPVAASAMPLNVKTITGATFTLEVESQETIATIKERIRDQHGTNVEEQRLVFEGKTLEDGKTLNDYNIPKGATINLILRSRGG